jgi:MFS family permease
VRHFSVLFASMLLVFTAVAGLLFSPLIGSLVDKLGPVPVIVTAFALNSVALAIWAFEHSTTVVILTDVLLTITGGAYWGPGSTLLARLIDEEHRQRAFGLNFMFVNLGIGLGGLISATIVDLHHPFTFSIIYLLNAAMTFLIGILFATLWKFGRREDSSMTKEQEEEGWGEVLRDRRLIKYVLASLVLMLGGYGSQEAGLSLYVVNNLHLSVHSIGFMIFANTSTIVVTQLFVTNHVEGRSRTRVMATVGVLWFIFWIILFAAVKMSPIAAILSICLVMAIFAVGETMMNPIGSALINEIAPDHLRGRYNAASGLTWGVSSMFASGLTALFFSAHLGAWWPLFIGIASLCGSLMMLQLRSSLSAKEDGRVTQ